MGEECGFGEEETKSCKCRTIAVCCTVLQCVAVCSRVLQCVVESCKCRASGDGEEPTVVKVVAQLITEYLSSPCPPPSKTQPPLSTSNPLWQSNNVWTRTPFPSLLLSPPTHPPSSSPRPPSFNPYPCLAVTMHRGRATSNCRC